MTLDAPHGVLHGKVLDLTHRTLAMRVREGTPVDEAARELMLDRLPQDGPTPAPPLHAKAADWDRFFSQFFSQLAIAEWPWSACQPLAAAPL